MRNVSIVLLVSSLLFIAVMAERVTITAAGTLTAPSVRPPWKALWKVNHLPRAVSSTKATDKLSITKNTSQ
jgi:hypothetical protein